MSGVKKSATLFVIYFVCTVLDREELDYEREADYIEELGHNAEDSEAEHLPTVYRRFTTKSYNPEIAGNSR
jgi:predicted unusual protein kinase regulating ubiquinone biosynthesis (AarF/ABC1/UbiB family)